MLNWINKEVDVSELKRFDQNPRKIRSSQREILRRSLNTYGQAVPLICDTDYTVLGGNQRLGLIKGKVLVRVPDRKLTEREQQYINIALNNHIGDWDTEMLLQGPFSKDELEIDFGIDNIILNRFDFGVKEFNLDDEQFEINEKSIIQITLPTNMPVSDVIFDLLQVSGKDAGEEGLVWLIIYKSRN